jgi:hypothetical protein
VQRCSRGLVELWRASFRELLLMSSKTLNRSRKPAFGMVICVFVVALSPLKISKPSGVCVNVCTCIFVAPETKYRLYATTSYRNCPCSRGIIKKDGMLCSSCLQNIATSLPCLCYAELRQASSLAAVLIRVGLVSTGTLPVVW